MSDKANNRFYREKTDSFDEAKKRGDELLPQALRKIGERLESEDMVETTVLNQAADKIENLNILISAMKAEVTKSAGMLLSRFGITDAATHGLKISPYRTPYRINEEAKKKDVCQQTFEQCHARGLYPNYTYCAICEHNPLSTANNPNKQP